jgi:pimeloyl-ACP methyl ester carboxylesterase
MRPALILAILASAPIYGDHEFIPEACARHIAEAIPKARFVKLRDCGHFSYLE